MHLARVLATYGIDEVRVACQALRQPAGRGLRLEPAAAPQIARFFRDQMGPPLTNRWLQRRVAISRAAAVCPPRRVVTIGEGQTLLQPSTGVGKYVGIKPGGLYLQYEGMNPSGSFKDNGMSAAFTHARTIGATRAACASTGNTSASLALYCSVTKLMKALIFIGSGKISYGKLSQALDYGALTMQIAGDFDDAMARVQEVSQPAGHLPGQQRESVPAGRPKDDHVPRARGPALASARLDRRAGRKPGQLQRLWQGV